MTKFEACEAPQTNSNLGGDYLVPKVQLENNPLATGPAVWGIADTHTHIMAHLAYGGKLMHGAPAGRMCEVLGSCESTHGKFGLSLSGLIDGPHGTMGFPTFDGWPKHSSRVHQQMHVDWIRRAFDGGLRLLVSLAVDNSLLARLVGGTGVWDERQSVVQQLVCTRQFVERNGEWMQVARGPREARQIIISNRLAVVLGMEVDSLGLDGLISPVQRAQWLKELYHDLGLRHIFPIHLTDNAFGGAAVYDEKFDFVNYYVNKEGFELTKPVDDKIDFCFGGGFTGCALSVLRRLIGMQPRLITGGCVNAKGLGKIGREELLPAMMKLGMVIDVDHMSARSISQTLDIVEHYKYPVVAGHAGFRELALGRRESNAPHRLANEYCRSASEVQRIARLGGVVAVGLNQGDVRTCPSAAVANDCAGTSKSFAQSYLYATSLCNEKGIAIGSDMNGFAGSPGPRFGAEAAVALRFDAKRRHLRRQQAAAQAEAINYDSVSGSDLKIRRHEPLSAAVAGNRSFNLNYDGVAHYGMLPDFVQDLHNVGVTLKQLVPLFRSAEDYIRVWERCEHQKSE